MPSILCFGVLGTIASFVIIAGALYLLLGLGLSSFKVDNGVGRGW
jgi:hypothetical protein